MTGSLVDRATSDMLIGPDWAMNVEICDILNHDPGLAKDVVRGIKKRIGSKNPKVQLLALTLLETMIKNCGDIIHMHIAEKDIPHQMVKILKKKPDFHVKEKILVLIDTWQEGFGGPQARHPQFYAAYQELLRAGAVFPQRRNKSAPIFSAQTRPGLRKTDYQQDEPGSSADSDFPVLSLTEIQSARGIMDVLAEMLNALDPGNKEELNQEVIVDLVRQCRSYRQRVVHLVNTTSDEDLLRDGLALNDDLQRVLDKHDAITAGPATTVEKPNSLQALVDIDDPAVTSADGSTHPDQRPTTSTGDQLLHTMPNGAATSSAKADPFIDLLCGEDYSTPAAENPLALVAVTEPLANPATEQNALVLSDMLSQNNDTNSNNRLDIPFNSHSIFPAEQLDPGAAQLQLQQKPALYPNVGVPNSGIHQYENAAYAQDTQLNLVNPVWNGHVDQGLNPQQQELYATNEQGGSLPPPPWEIQPMQSSQLAASQTQLMQGAQMGAGMYPQAMPDSQLMHPGMMQSSQLGSMHPGMMQSSQQAGIYSQPMQGDQLAGYAYVQQPGSQYYGQRPMYPYAGPDEISQRMYGLSMGDNSVYMNTGQPYQMSNSTSYVKQPPKPPRPEDKLFGDLVTLAKSKPK